MTEREFLHSTLRYITTRIENYQKEIEMQDKRLEFLAWRIGTFTIPAVGVVFDSKHRVKYPENPIREREEPVDIENMSAEEIKELQEKELLKLDAMAKAAFREMEEQGE